ncbi:unnamed protein product [Dovyalis caffra]|uniref:Neprosin PEP catalytic domain-containing protein n=1 Tax=Dovyalis caffra TaxID=77055 RepID=A0AAV1SQK8_9ROSI|nr:unnamed protein product [Dovyalis caffra]
MQEKVIKTYVKSLTLRYPYWNMTLGADHFFVSCHDVGSRATEEVPFLLKNAIRLVCSPSYDSNYIPQKDVALPQILELSVPPTAKSRPFLPSSDYCGEYRRTKLGFWAGFPNSDVRKNLRIFWKDVSGFDIHTVDKRAERAAVLSAYEQELYESKFCICPRGETQVDGVCLAESMAFGCVPDSKMEERMSKSPQPFGCLSDSAVILSDYYDLPFHDVFDWNKFSVMVKENDFPRLKQILEGIPAETFEQMRQNVLQVRKHFKWNSPPVKDDEFHMVMYELWKRRHIIRLQTKAKSSDLSPIPLETMVRSMTIRITQAILCLLCLLSRNIEVEAGRQLSREEDLELEKQLKLMNKPAVKTIKTIYGDIYNCVDFYQQPAFDHPLLKNHTSEFKARPSFTPKESNTTYKDHSTIFNPRNIWLNKKGCPIGTVPIRKTTKDDLIRAKLAAEIYSSKFNPQSGETPGLHLAILRTQPDPIKKYYGGGMSPAIYNPPVQNSQSSYARMKIKNGADYIEAGWMVNPTIYKDNQTRSYIYTNAGASQCFNLYCSGFVHVSTVIPVDAVYVPVSEPGPEGKKYIDKFKIERDDIPGNWYLTIGFNDTIVGFWNYRIFKTGLNNFATYIDWGGQVYGPPNLPSPGMGSGEKFVQDMTYNAYCCQLTVANQTHSMDLEGVEEYVDVDAYSLRDYGNIGGFFRRYFLYGGSGGYIGN